MWSFSDCSFETAAIHFNPSLNWINQNLVNRICKLVIFKMLPGKIEVIYNICIEPRFKVLNCLFKLVGCLLLVFWMGITPKTRKKKSRKAKLICHVELIRQEKRSCLLRLASVLMCLLAGWMLECVLVWYYRWNLGRRLSVWLNAGHISSPFKWCAALI